MRLQPKTKKYLIQISLTTLIILLFSSTFTILYLRYNQPSPNLITIRKDNPESSVSKFIPNQQFDAQKKFLDTINYQLQNLPQTNTYEYILLRAYGAIFINQNPEIKLPPKVIVDNEQDTKQIQDNLQLTLVEGTQECYLQKAAADAFNQARNIIDIPLKSGYSGDCTRSFATNLRFWQKYTNNQTLEQVKQGKETNILSVVAPPGTSQHLWGLALDLRVSNQEQREALNQNGWFQTVAKDVPHWTYLGWDEESLPKFGLQEKIISGITYWLTPI
ncbi:MAG: D-alanyl-D-alanine carboxypeptidase family protein [Sphaerospermopsis kisseleviana]|uniref:D-alanyl-D-alanine carboxypeptidase family protein n=1 Tax=Sphaerospermopsis sp. LEGE 00249 TaxID=1380707 RepID=UPI00164DC629|nr:D-alanyl-D-alanine carboxypeptidase family protein [Sphaerospermopsis sp. LEGE 00249]MBC5795160.1 D-alanyl-D-alanine carboxypeptidase family protein [Sphaerospermopsis sp. LEGE 00249]MEB3148258.1 D-alanyl-D-alanine carboxypeptidase family protein [Sphaerospermopsis sp.]